MPIYNFLYQNALVSTSSNRVARSMSVLTSAAILLNDNRSKCFIHQNIIKLDRYVLIVCLSSWIYFAWTDGRTTRLPDASDVGWWRQQFKYYTKSNLTTKWAIQNQLILVVDLPAVVLTCLQPHPHGKTNVCHLQRTPGKPMYCFPVCKESLL